MLKKSWFFLFFDYNSNVDKKMLYFRNINIYIMEIKKSKKKPSRKWPNFNNWDNLKKKKLDSKKDWLSKNYNEWREDPANKKPKK